MAGLFDILVNLRADTAQLVSGIDQAQKKIEGFVASTERIVSRVAAFGAFGLSVEGVAHAIEHAVSAGAQLERLSIRVGTSGQAFSELAYAASQTGIGADQLATAMTKMEKAMGKAATGDKAVTETLEALGLSFKDLQKLSPEQQLEVIADRISRLPTPADKARAEIALFGKAGAELAPLLEQGAAGIEKLRAEARDLGASFSDDLLKSLEDSEKSIKRMDTSMSALWTTIFGKLSPGIKYLADQFTGLISGDMNAKMRAQAQMLEALLQSGAAGAIRLGQLGYGSTREARMALDYLKSQLAIQQEVQNTISSFTQPDMSKLLGGSAPGYQPDPLDALHPVHIKEQKVYQDKMTALLEEFQHDTKDELEKAADGFYKFEAELNELRKEGLIDAQEYTKRLLAELDKLLPGVHPKEKLRLPVKTELDDMQKEAEKAAARIEGAFADFLFEPFNGGVKKMAVEFLDAMRRLAADVAAEKLFSALFGDKGSDSKGAFGSGGLGSVLGDLLSRYLGGGKAGGGSVSAGTTYLVGEQGPELFTAASHGTITPSGALGGWAGDVHMGGVNIDARGADAGGLAQLRAALPAILSAHAANTKAQLLQAFRRSGLSAPVRA